MEEYADSGKVRSIGISNFNPHYIDDLLAYATRPYYNAPMRQSRLFG